MIVIGGCADKNGDGKSNTTFIGTRLAADSMVLLLDSSAESLDSCQSELMSSFEGGSSSEGGLLRETFL